MKIICASAAFKGGLNAIQATDIISRAFGCVFPQAQIIQLPMADGSAGTGDVLAYGQNAQKLQAPAVDPLGREILADYVVLNDTDAVIEAAAVIGPDRLRNSERNPYNTSSWGLGLLLRQAIERGYKKIYVALGDCATNDGGIGAVAALGARFLDGEGKELPAVARSLNKIRLIDTKDLLDCRDIKIVVLCDVDNPLLGSEGTTLSFGEKKGASLRQKEILEEGMANYCDVLWQHFRWDMRKMSKGGAGGGLAAALFSFLNAELRSGIDAVIDISGLRTQIQDADLIISGQGAFDGSACEGKVLQRLGLICGVKEIPYIALVDASETVADVYTEYYFSALPPIIEGYLDKKEASERAGILLQQAAMRAAKLVRLGIKM